MSNRKILFVVEGIVDEGKLIERTNCIYGMDEKFEIYSYNTTIHELARKIFINDELDEDIDLLLTLKQNERNLQRIKVLSERYTDIYLVFDFEPNYQVTEFEKVRKMLKFFNDSTNNGRLCINYPMMQSYKHIHALPDNAFKDLKFDITSQINYKELVDKESKYSNIKCYDYITLTSIMLHHMKKFNYIISSRYEIMSADELKNIDYVQLYEEEMRRLKEYKKIDVINTYILSVLEYAPIKFINQVINGENKFLI